MNEVVLESPRVATGHTFVRGVVLVLAGYFQCVLVGLFIIGSRLRALVRSALGYARDYLKLLMNLEADIS